MKKLPVALVLLGLALSACAPQSPNAGPTPEQKEAARKTAADTFVHMTKGQAQVSNFFDGPGGLIGLVVTSGDGKNNIAWATSDGSHIVVGAVVDRDGLNKTGVYARELAIIPGPQTALRNVDGSVTVEASAIDSLKPLIDETVGTGGRELYVVIDPLCPHCRHSYQAMQDQAALKGLKVHWITSVVVGGQNSEQLIEKYRNKQLSLAQIMASGPGNPEPRAVDAGTRQHLEATLKILDDVVRARAVPAVIYQEDGVWKSRTGFNPADYLR